MAPNEFQGSVIGGINRRAGIIQNTDMSDDGSGCVIQADVPLAQVRLVMPQRRILIPDLHSPKYKALARVPFGDVFAVLSSLPRSCG